MARPLDDLLDRNLVIFAGKGGVGKTTCSSATALALSKAGRKTLLVTVDPAKRLSDSLDIDVGFEELPIQPNLTAMMLDPEAVIKEHLKREVPGLSVTEHPMFRYVTNYMPGLNELMAIGKLNDLRREGKYDVIVVDTAPTGHALSFLWAPKTIQELMSERSVLKWALKGYAVWQQLSSTAKKVQNVFKKKDDRSSGPPEIDFEKIFSDIENEATRIREFLTDPNYSALVLVTLAERMPVEETIDLYEQVEGDLGMNVTHIVVNKMQPDVLGEHRAAFDALADDSDKRKAFVQDTAKATGVSAELVDALVDGARFGEVRRAMNVTHLDDLASRLQQVPLLVVPLFKEDVTGLRRLAEFEAALMGPGAQVRQPVLA